MKLMLLTLAAPLCSALVIQDILGDLRDLEDELFSSENPLDEAIESSPTFFPAEALDDTEIDKYKINTDKNAWIKHFFNNHPIDRIANPPSDLIDFDLGLDTDISLDTYPHHSTKTIYQLLSESKYTTILTKIINEDPELVQFLNSTEHKFTIFAPTDSAFKKIPHHHKGHDGNGDGDGGHHGHEHGNDDGGDGDGDGDHIPKEIIRLFARYHSSPEVLNAAKLFHRHTIPSALHDPFLGGSDHGKGGDGDHETGLPQRLAVRSGFRGLTLNFYSHIVAADIGASNGIIHGIDSILLPPPRTLLLLDILPTYFSTFNLALQKTHLDHYLNTTSSTTGKGFTLFTPSNSAFERLGLKINAFLFSPWGKPYLEALLKYHVVPGKTLYSDVLYTSDGEVKPFGKLRVPVNGVRKDEEGFTHLDLPTLLPDHEIAVDVEHWGPYVGFKVNGWQRVGFADVLGKDGVIHVLEKVLIPPKKVEGLGVFVDDEKGEMELEEFMERMRPWVEGADGDEGFGRGEL